jgi:hypothetical protein
MLLSLQRKPMRLDLIGLAVPDLETVRLGLQRSRPRHNARGARQAGALLELRATISSALNADIQLAMA